jgi:prevent-host-death family protein
MQVNMLEAKTQLSKLVEAALRGEEVIIANRGKPMVRLVPAEPAKAKRKWGLWKGLISEAEVDAAFTPEVDAEIAAEFLKSLDRDDPLMQPEPEPAPRLAAPRRTRNGAKA